MKPKGKLRICDECVNSVSKAKCQICNKDLCSECIEKIIFRFSLDEDGDEYNTEEVASLITLVSCVRCYDSMRLNEKDIYEAIKDSRQYKAFFNLIKKSTLRLSAINPAKPRPKDKDGNESPFVKTAQSYTGLNPKIFQSYKKQKGRMSWIGSK